MTELDTAANDYKNDILSQAVRVILTSLGGVQLPACESHDVLPLGHTELLFLGEIARDESRNVTAAARRLLSGAADPASLRPVLDAFVAALDARQLLTGCPGPEVLRPRSAAPSPQPGLALDQVKTLITELPLVLSLSPAGFEAAGHDGRLRRALSPEDVMLLRVFCEERDLAAGFDAWRAQCSGPSEPSRDDFDARVLGLIGARLLRADGAAGQEYLASRVNTMGARMSASTAVMDTHANALRWSEQRRRGNDAPARVQVVPVSTQRSCPPLALGLLIANARAYEGGRLQSGYFFMTDWEPRVMRLESYARDPSVFLFSHYVWSSQRNIELSARVKAANPASLNVHGGPNAPKYPGDVEAYFRAHPHVDVLVHGEGEETFCELLAALEGTFGEGLPDLSRLKHVPGLSFRLGEAVIRTAPRAQIKDVDAIPSPLLEGLFEVYEQAPPVAIALETNRGCPYGCTFCDWGSATASKVRRFSLERVFAELEWCARNHVDDIFIADANFGMFERDVEIAGKIADLRHEYGYPRLITTNYAKNKVKYLRQIVEILAGAGILTEGLLSLQSMDEQTLSAIDRSNIKTDKYDELAVEFRKAGLPLYVDIMLGLPGSTRSSFANDLQECIDREVVARLFQTELLINSPMNAPAYREKYRIETATAASGWGNSRVTEQSGLGRAIVVACSTFTRDDYREMLDLRLTFRLFENFGVLRQVARFVRQETGVREIDLIEHLRSEARAFPETWPHLNFTIRSVPRHMAVPVSWELLLAEVRAFLIRHYALADDSALHTIFTVQKALLPAPDRRFPQRLRLKHDFAAWHRAMMQAKMAGRLTDWVSEVPRLGDLPPARLVVTDPAGVSRQVMGFNMDENLTADWELGSPAARNTARRYMEYADSA